METGRLQTVYKYDYPCSSSPSPAPLQRSEELQGVPILLPHRAELLLQWVAAGPAEDHQGDGGRIRRGTVEGAWETKMGQGREVHRPQLKIQSCDLGLGRPGVEAGVQAVES